MPESRRIAYRAPGALSEVLLSDPAGGWRDGQGRLAICRGISGGGAVARTFNEAPAPGQAGTIVRGLQRAFRDLDLPFHFEASDPILLRGQLRDLIALLDTDSPGTLTVYSPAGVRQITAYYAGGLELDETTGNAGPAFLGATLQFHCPDPYWTSPSIISKTLPIGVPTPFFPLLPLHLTRGELAGSDTVINPGDADTYPRWTITGPGGPITLTNSRTGEWLTWSGTLAAGEILVIDTDPAVGTVQRSDGTSAYSQLAAGSSFWSLGTGATAVTVDYQAATADSAITLTATPRYRAL